MFITIFKTLRYHKGVKLPVTNCILDVFKCIIMDRRVLRPGDPVNIRELDAGQRYTFQWGWRDAIYTVKDDGTELNIPGISCIEKVSCVKNLFFYIMPETE